MAESVIEKLVSDNGYGFIQGPKPRHGYFFHMTGVIGHRSFNELQEGDRVRFKLKPSKNRPGTQQAYDVEVIAEAKGHSLDASREPAHSQPDRKSVAGLPYGFVPIDVEQAATDTPVWHDGSTPGPLLSGEIRCSIETLTPTLPGNYRYPLKEADQAKRATWGYGGNLSSDLSKKQVAEPLMLPDKRVVIAGSAIKGMLRQSLGALLSAPMERVAERHHSYRANLGNAKKRARLECRPAVITALHDDRIDIDVLPAETAVFLHSEHARRVVQRHTPGSLMTDTIRGVRLVNKSHKWRLEDANNASAQLDHYVYSYTGGIDGKGILAKAFGKGRGQVHDEALVPRDQRKRSIAKSIPTGVVEQYRRTQRVLADETAGHLTEAHPLSKTVNEQQKNGWSRLSKEIKDAAKLSVNQLIYVEIEVDHGTLGEVRTFGHNYQYYWAYSSSVRRVGGKPRSCLTPLSAETDRDPNGQADQAPRELSAARLLFGYVHDENHNPIGKGVYERLAGRVAINHAVSDGVPEFLGEEARGYAIPLRILGQPKSSAWEFYLQQPSPNAPGATPATYGDAPGQDGGELAGRKFYPHQPQADEQWIKGNGEAAKSSQATLARFICKPQTRFKFAIRFSQLRPWELAALLAVLEPQRLAPATESPTGDYAHKLGLGRPLGMGSVRISCDEIRVRKEGEAALIRISCDEIRVRKEGEAALIGTSSQSALITRGLEELRSRLTDDALTPWLNVHRYEDRRRLGFPLAANKRGVQTIFEWHTQLHRDYGRKRREQGDDWSDLLKKINMAKGSSGIK